MTKAQYCFLAALADGCGGVISFERFMEEALFHPEWGYYSTNIRTVGRRGDFSTAVTLNPLLARALAQWIARTSSELGECWSVIELGGGTGELALGILGSLGWWRRRRLVYQIVEISKPLLHEQKRRLSGFSQVHWRTSLIDALENCGGRALIFSNEFVDAFPVRLFRKHAGQWQECVLRFEGTGVEEVWIETAPPASSAVVGIHRLPEGNRIEVAEAYHRWLTSWVPFWRSGQFLTIDYGDLFPALYHRRPFGTLRGFFHHHLVRGAELIQRFGHQDLTADVNFSDLISWGTSLGLEVCSFHSLAEWGRQWIPREIHKVPTTFADPVGVGGFFKVLCQTSVNELARSNSTAPPHDPTSNH